MKQYLELMKFIRTTGVVKKDRTGTGTISVFGTQMRFNLQEGFPMVTTKKLFLKGIIHELLWFLSGDTNIKYLVDNNVHIWDEWADENGDLGPVYGYQWRSWPGKVCLKREDQVDFRDTSIVAFHADGDNKGVYALQQGIDQITNVINMLKNNPDSRRLMVSAWNPAQVDQMKLPPCHAVFQFYTRELTLAQRESQIDLKNASGYEYLSEEDKHGHLDAKNVPRRFLDCQLYQRSADYFLGVPFNIASYALLVHMIAQQCNMLPGEFVWTGGDTHLYLNHLEQADLQLTREPHPLPKLVIQRKPDSIFDYKYEDFKVEGYVSHPHIPAEVSK